MMNIDKKTLVIIILVIVLIAVVGNNYYEKYQQSQQQRRVGLVQAGYTQAIIDVARLASTCQAVPLIIGNQTINMIAVECLQVRQG